jgi:hypothetical protein
MYVRKNQYCRRTRRKLKANQTNLAIQIELVNKVDLEVN